mmetsp:Transcript_147223/g.455391  ORF Transcript_147223/g.455391 Transcript_147223/m.455391 type:complete len:209 (-) Transcript_147223:116-742(-)
MVRMGSAHPRALLYGLRARRLHSPSIGRRRLQAPWEPRLLRQRGRGGGPRRRGRLVGLSKQRLAGAEGGRPARRLAWSPDAARGAGTAVPGFRPLCNAAQEPGAGCARPRRWAAIAVAAPAATPRLAMALRQEVDAECGWYRKSRSAADPGARPGQGDGARRRDHPAGGAAASGGAGAEPRSELDVAKPACLACGAFVNGTAVVSFAK